MCRVQLRYRQQSSFEEGGVVVVAGIVVSAEGVVGENGRRRCGYRSRCGRAASLVERSLRQIVDTQKGSLRQMSCKS
jgi:hypothetical protein